MKLTGSQIDQVQEALLDGYDESSLQQLVRVVLAVDLRHIAGGENFREIVFHLIDWVERVDQVAALIGGAYNHNPTNASLLRLVQSAQTWAQVSDRGLVLLDGRAAWFATRDRELAYLTELNRQYAIWAQKYTPLAGIAEVRAAAAAGPRLDLPMLFMPTGFEKLEEHGFHAARAVQRLPVADLREAVAAYQRLVLLGEPGAGKTTTLWRLTYDLAQDALRDPAKPLPLLVPLGSYTGDEGALAYIQGYFDRLGPHLPAYLTRGRVILLLDALNEMPQQGYRARVGRIQTLLDDFDATPVLITCRVLDYVESLHLEKLEVKPLDPERQRAYLHRYLGEADGEQLFWQLMDQEYAELWAVWQAAGGTWEQFWTAEKMPEAVYGRTTGHQDRLWEALRAGELPPLLALGVNPFMLVMLAQVYAAQQGVLPRNRGKLFAAFVDTLLQREARRCDPRRWPGAARLRTALGGLAYAMQRAGERGTAVDRAWALAQLGGDGEPAQFFQLAAGATLLDVTGEQVRFVHQLIQEYFAALAWYGQWVAGAPLAKQWPEGWLEPSGWEETAVLLAGILPAEGQSTITDFVNELVVANPPLAARCIGESGGIQPDAVCISHVQQRLVAIATGTEFSIRHRTLAADALNYVDDPRLGVGLTPDGLPDIIWCVVPGGEFTMGNTKQSDEMAYDDEAPQHQVYLDDFGIAKYPITNAQYAAFVGDGGYSERWRHCWTTAGWRWRLENNISDASKQGGDFDWANHPVVGVSWYEAMAFCNWLSAKLGRTVRLPSEAQWEKAARGMDGRRYPWAGALTAEHANWSDTQIGSTSAVGLFPRGASPYDVLDMAGNVWEWTSSKYQGYRYDPTDGREDPEGDGRRTLRGGSFGYDDFFVRCAFRVFSDPNLRDVDLGFRVVVSSPGC